MDTIGNDTFRMECSVEMSYYGADKQMNCLRINVRKTIPSRFPVPEPPTDGLTDSSTQVLKKAFQMKSRNL
jgi:hypothetical protein